MMTVDTGINRGRQITKHFVMRTKTETTIYINKQARTRAEERQAEVNESKRRKHIKAHRKNNDFEIPNINISKQRELTDEQTNHSFFNGKE
eukprot:5973954-Heterocapsa_arctica.AAC.1